MEVLKLRIQDTLLEVVDDLAAESGTTRSAYVRRALIRQVREDGAVWPPAKLAVRR